LLEGPRHIFVGGKGGVGKTTVAASIGLRLGEASQRTLVVSTDPAHSLGDCFHLSHGSASRPVEVTKNVFALELDAQAALEELQEVVSSLGVRQELEKRGLLHLLGKIGVDVPETSAVLLPLLKASPGIDEFVALAKLQQVLHASGENSFERIVVDTAPTGHTLRLLGAPGMFLGALDKAKEVQEQLKTSIDPLSSVARTFLRSIDSKDAAGQSIESMLESGTEKMSEWADRLREADNKLRDASSTEFVLVTVPSRLAVAETLRLQADLSVPVRAIVLNQVPPLAIKSWDVEGALGRMKGLGKAEKAGVEEELRRASATAISAQMEAETLTRALPDDIDILRVRAFATAPTGAPALSSFGESIFADEKAPEAEPEPAPVETEEVVEPESEPASPSATSEPAK
jgi:arsenite-transporting ATPase